MEADNPLPAPAQPVSSTSADDNVPPQKKSSQWLIWALTSGGFAAFNGVFAKLSFRALEDAVADGFATQNHDHANGGIRTIGVPPFRPLRWQQVRRSARPSGASPPMTRTSRYPDKEYSQTFFGLNLVSNAIMWILFTRALTAATSTTRVSILNTSANFMVTAILSMMIFGEGLPLGWWAGAALLVAGSVIIGTREEGEVKKQGGPDGGIALADGDGGTEGAASDATKPYEDEDDGRNRVPIK
ncbi:MAG: hypothetical protein M1828_007399 [Chrysothrix sp. TS-e1954]|nr:MAG: hypothetical protein M1828_007399 [Chrysothrix sp. TS-e1954]